MKQQQRGATFITEIKPKIKVEKGNSYDLQLFLQNMSKVYGTAITFLHGQVFVGENERAINLLR